MIFIGSDHLGYQTKERAKEYLLQRGYKVEDTGPKGQEVVDYPEHAEAVARNVAKDPNHRGILFSDTGQGMCMAANKMKNAYAVVVYNEGLAEKSRSENNSNILCIPCQDLSFDSIKQIISIWLSSSFSGAESSIRHVRQIKKIESDGK